LPCSSDDHQSAFYGIDSLDACFPRVLPPPGSRTFAYYPQFIIGLVISIVQRRFFHPFNSVPGPWANSVSELPATLALVSGNQHIYYRWLHEKYGPVVRVSPDELSFVSVEAREEIYGLRVSDSQVERFQS